MNIQFLPQSAGCFSRTRVLKSDDLNEVRNAGPVVGIILFAGKSVYLDSDRRVWLFLQHHHSFSDCRSNTKAQWGQAFWTLSSSLAVEKDDQEDHDCLLAAITEALARARA